jgi:hypothetical protein
MLSPRKVGDVCEGSSSSLTVSPGEGDGDIQVSGRIIGLRRSPAANTQVEFYLLTVDGMGMFYEYRQSGIVPNGAERAIAGFRLNTECNCMGESLFRLEAVRYFENGTSGNQVPNGDFLDDLQGWNVYGEAAVRLVESPENQALLVETAYGKPAGLNSTDFPVTSGTQYIVYFKSQVASQSTGSGVFMLAFLGPEGEIMRINIPIEEMVTRVGDTITDADGVYRFNMNSLPPGTYQLEARVKEGAHSMALSLKTTFVVAP